MRLAQPRKWLLALMLPLLALSLAMAEGDPAPWLGVRLAALPGEEGGVAVSRIFTDSPADRAGLRARDVIVSFDGQPVRNLREVIERIRSHEPGAWASMTVMRQDDEMDLEVRLDTRPRVIKKTGMRRGWIGIKAINLPESLREHFGAPVEAGVMLSEVLAGSPAEAAGFRLGDVVYEVGEKPVVSIQGLHELIAGGGVGNEYEFAVARDGALLVLESPIETTPSDVR